MIDNDIRNAFEAGRRGAAKSMYYRVADLVARDYQHDAYNTTENAVIFIAEVRKAIEAYETTSANLDTALQRLIDE